MTARPTTPAADPTSVDGADRDDLVGMGVSVFCRDVDRLFTFYRDLLRIPEIVPSRSDLYRALRLSPSIELGFHADAALDLLAVRDRDRPEPSLAHYPTFMVASDVAVDEGRARAVRLGASVLVEPYETYYGAWQVVLADPEDNMFRLNHKR